LPSGHLAAWGWNRYGQLGLGHTNDALRPALVGKATNWTAAEAGDDFSIGLQSDGSLWAWGNNAYGQLGTGGEARALIPTRLGGTTRWASIALGQHFVFARKQDGSLWGWGRNEKGQLGLATTGHVWKPIRLADPGVVWRQLTGNYEHSAGIKADGSLWTWGENSLGRLGRELPVPSRQPIPVTNGVWKEVSAGFAHCAALRDDGTLWSWGWNSHGQLGLGEVGTVVAPKQIGQDTDWRAVSAAAEHTLALKTDGSLWAWGSGMFGEIGDGARFDRRVPTRVGDETNWVSLPVVNGSASFAIKNDGSLWGWGLNRGGQLGDGTRESPAHPIRILPQP
jgi:alpha-tubulin suppressor-like RCC1 family protein